MNLNQYKNQTGKLSQRTLCFLVRDGKVLLGLKKTGFGKGNWLGIGGKVEVGETIEQAMKREVLEEIGVRVIDAYQTVILNFYFPFVNEPEKWNQQGHVFLARDWKGEPSESEEIRPQWFYLNEIPFEQMWDDAGYWLKRVLSRERFEADFLFNPELKVLEHRIQVE